MRANGLHQSSAPSTPAAPPESAGRQARPPAPPAAELALEPVLVGRRKAASLCGVSVATWHRLMAAGKVPASVRLGGRVLWRVEELRAWSAAGCPDRRTWEALRTARSNGRRV